VNREQRRSEKGSVNVSGSWTTVVHGAWRESEMHSSCRQREEEKNVLHDNFQSRA